MRNFHTIDVQVHKPVNDGFRVKVSIIDLGMYLNGVLVFPPNEQHADWVVYPPVMNIGGYRKMYPAEFNKKERLWLEITQACIEAVQVDQSYDISPSADDFTTGLKLDDMSKEETDRQLKELFPDDTDV